MAAEPAALENHVAAGEVTHTTLASQLPWRLWPQEIGQQWQWGMEMPSSAVEAPRTLDPLPQW